MFRHVLSGLAVSSLPAHPCPPTSDPRKAVHETCQHRNHQNSFHSQLIHPGHPSTIDKTKPKSRAAHLFHAKLLSPQHLRSPLDDCGCVTRIIGTSPSLNSRVPAILHDAPCLSSPFSPLLDSLFFFFFAPRSFFPTRPHSFCSRSLVFVDLFLALPLLGLLRPPHRFYFCLSLRPGKKEEEEFNSL